MVAIQDMAATGGVTSIRLRDSAAGAVMVVMAALVMAVDLVSALDLASADQVTAGGKI